MFKSIVNSREILEPEERDLMMQLSPLLLEKIQSTGQIGGIKEAQTLIRRLLNRWVVSLSPAIS